MDTLKNENKTKKSNTNDDGCTSDYEEGGANVFARSGKLTRSPVSNPVATVSTSESNSLGKQPGTPRERSRVLDQMFTPKSNSGTLQVGLQLGRSGLEETRRKIDELHVFVRSKPNVHKIIIDMVVGIKSAVAAAEREQNVLKKRAEVAEKAVMEVTEKVDIAAQETPKGPRNPRSEKRRRETPGEEEEQKKVKNDRDGDVEKEQGSVWRTIENRKEKKKKQVAKKKEDHEKKPKLRRERNKGDALIIEVKQGTSYADLLRKVKADPALKELGENVTKTRRTQKGEMLFELKRDPAVKSVAYKTLIEKTLGEEASVRALSQESVIECRDLDEITTEEELHNALKVQCDLGDVPISIRLRKAHGGTQTAAIRLATVVANRLVEKGRIKVGWSVCSLRATPRVTKQMERCFKCMSFGHQARNCRGPDRSDLCRKCGEKGHIARDCTKQPRCMLCTSEEGNDHMTGGVKCPVYKKARAGQQ